MTGEQVTLTGPDVEAFRRYVKAAVLREVADDIEACALAGWTAGQIATGLNNRAIQAENRFDALGVNPYRAEAPQ